MKSHNSPVPVPVPVTYDASEVDDEYDFTKKKRKLVTMSTGGRSYRSHRSAVDELIKKQKEDLRKRFEAEIESDETDEDSEEEPDSFRRSKYNNVSKECKEESEAKEVLVHEEVQAVQQQEPPRKPPREKEVLIRMVLPEEKETKRGIKRMLSDLEIEVKQTKLLVMKLFRLLS